MAVITDECINCGSCIDECPNTAIYNAGESYKIDGQVYPPLSEDHAFVVSQKCDDCGTCKEACAIGAIE